MRWQQIANKVISESVSLLRAPLPQKTGLRILTYHTVGNKAYGDQLNLNTIGLDLFKQHINTLSTHSVVPLNSKAFINTKALDLADAFHKGKDDFVTENSNKATEILSPFPKKGLAKVKDREGETHLIKNFKEIGRAHV